MPGIDSVKNGCEKAVQEGLNNIHLLEGTHIVTGDYVLFEVPMTVSGDGREKTFVEGGGFEIGGERDQHCTFFDLTIQKTEGCGLQGYKGMSFDCRRVKFDKCGRCGVDACATKGRLTNCQVTNCGGSGVFSAFSTIEIEGEESRINNNCTDGDSDDYGLKAASSDSIIHLLSPLTKEDVSTNNSGGGNYGGHGTIETVNSFEQKEEEVIINAGETKTSAEPPLTIMKEEIAKMLGVPVNQIVSSYIIYFCVLLFLLFLFRILFVKLLFVLL